MNNRKVILNSGGMDSFFVAMRVPDALHVFVDIGQGYASKEAASAARIARHFSADIHFVQGANIGLNEHKPSGIIPLRNAELILCAGQYGDDIYLGVLENEINSDKSPEFLRAMETVMTISCRPQYWSEGRSFHLHTPLGTQSKADLLSELLVVCGMNRGHPSWQACLQTVSCYSAKNHHCGACASCFKRWVALTVATDIDHAAQFERHPAAAPLQFWKDKGYPEKRINEIEHAYTIAGLE